MTYEEGGDSIDQVIQNGQPVSSTERQRQQETTRENTSALRSTRESPLTRNSPAEFAKGKRHLGIQSRGQSPWDDQRYGRSTRTRWDRDIINTNNRTDRDGSGRSRATITSANGAGPNSSNMTDFFSAEVLQIVLRDPTTTHHLLRFCQSREFRENLEFLQKVDAYNRLLDELATTLGSIHATYTSPNAPSQINISHQDIEQVSSDLKHASQYTLPSLENIFLAPQEHVQKLFATDIYPRFVKHQMTASAALALADHRERFAGLGDCFCLTDPTIADNPILFASDGFVSVTGYARKDIIPRNCRFLQGPLTDHKSVQRLRSSIEQREETVELLLNYKKNGDPFWNLLYCAPLFDERGEVAFFLGGQINCSTTIHSCNDVLRILSTNDDELDKGDEEAKSKPSRARSREKKPDGPKFRSAFFKSFRKYKSTASPSSKEAHVREEAGMEGELLTRVGKMKFETQVEAFYTAYSKYLVLSYDRFEQTLTIRFFSPGFIDMLYVNIPNGGVPPIHGKDIFWVLAEHTSSSSSSVAKHLKISVRDALRAGKAVSIETALLVGFAEKNGGGWLGGSQESLGRVEEQYVTHWTPLKDKEGRVEWVVLIIAPKL